MKIGDICSNIRDKGGLGTFRTLLGKGLNLGLIELKTGTVKRLLRVAVHQLSAQVELKARSQDTIVGGICFNASYKLCANCEMTYY